MITLELGERASHISVDGQPLTGPLPLGSMLLREEAMHHLGFTQLQFAQR
jgi:hypothetical protein